MDAFDRARECLSEEGFLWISHRKMLSAYRGCAVCDWAESGDGWSMALRIPVSASPFDQSAYPGARWVVYLASSPNGGIADAIERLPREPSVFKLVSEEQEQAVRRRFALRRTRAYLSYTCSDFHEEDDARVIRSDVFSVEGMPLWGQNGYTETGVRGFFEQGARSTVLREEGLPVAACLSFPNDGEIWEIGALYTVPEYRNRGFARIVARAAASDLLRKGKMPRYQVVESNVASVSLVESMGWRRVLTLTHFLSE